MRRWIGAGGKFDGGEKVETAVTQHDILPIVLGRCTACHGLRRQEGGLDLHTRAAMLRGAKSGPGIVPGKPEESLAIKRILLGQRPRPTRLLDGSAHPVETAENELLARRLAVGAAAVPIDPSVAPT